MGWGRVGRAGARGTLKRMRHTGRPARIAPVARDVGAGVEGDVVNVAIRSPADAPGPSIAITGRHDVSRATGAADLRLGPVRFGAGGRGAYAAGRGVQRAPAGKPPRLLGEQQEDESGPDGLGADLDGSGRGRS